MASPNTKLVLPKGWTKHESKRINGRIGFYIKSPKGNIFRSKKSLAQFIEKNNLSLKIESFFDNSVEKIVQSPLNSSRSIDRTKEVNKDERNCQVETKEVYDKKLVKETMTQTDVTINTAIKCDEILGEKWITDDTLQSYFDLLNNNLLKRTNALILNPIISQAVKICEDYDHFLDEVDIRSKTLLMIPVNNAENPNTEGGSHWSLLVYSRNTQSFYYFDSSNNMNYEHADRIKNKLTKYLGPDRQNKDNSISLCDTPQQLNGRDCAIYSIFIIECIVDSILKDMELPLNIIKELRITPCDLITKRALLAYIVFNRWDITKETTVSLMFKHCLEGTGRGSSEVRYINESSEKNKGVLVTEALDKIVRKKMEKEVLVLADSQGRNLAKHIVNMWPSNDNTGVSSIFKPNAPFSEVGKNVKKHTEFFNKNDYLVILGGSNNVIERNDKKIIGEVKKLLELTEHTNIIIAGLPYRHHTPSLNNEISYLNMELEQIIKKTQHGSFLAIHDLQRSCYTAHGLHFNNRGKRKIAEMIMNIVLKKNDTLSKEKSQLWSFKENSINIVEANMINAIQNFRDDKETAFAHTISGDLADERNMTAGVAVVFRRAFGRPKFSDYVDSRLTVQNAQKGATIYSLVTKKRFFQKPTNEDYDQSFEQLTQHFTSKNLKTLICSPMGCERDRVDLERLVNNLYKFSCKTGATVVIISYDQQSRRTLRRGLSYQQFLEKMKEEVKKCTKNSGDSNSIYELDCPKKVSVDGLQNTCDSTQILVSSPQKQADTLNISSGSNDTSLFLGSLNCFPLLT